MSAAYLLVDYLPDRQESCLRGAVHGIETNNPVVRQALSSLEAPSAVATVGELCPGLSMSVGSIPEPDPREATRDVSIVLWRYDGVVARPAVASPPPDVAAAVGRVAHADYSLDRWSRAAREEASRLQQPATATLAVMVHTPAGPVDVTRWDWRFRVQVAAALVATHQTEIADRDALAMLSELVDGPVDWTTTAAIIAMLDVARREADLRKQVAAFLLQLLERPMNPIWFMCAMYPAAVACRRVPGLSERLYATLDGIIEKLSE